MKRIDLSGKIKERITIISFSHSHVQPSGQKRAMWNAMCSCGKMFKISTSTFSNPKAKSCGCYMDDRRKMGMIKRTPDSEIKQFLTHYKASSKVRNKIFNLSFDEFKKIILQNCFFCNELPQNKYTKVGKLRKIKYNGIDRFDNSLGYIKSNCVPCCGLCNRMKGESSIEEFKNKISNIYTHYVSIVKK